MYGGTSSAGKDCKGAKTAEPAVGEGVAATFGDCAKLVRAAVTRRLAAAQARARADRQPRRKD
jgi:hypothetical protein